LSSHRKRRNVITLVGRTGVVDVAGDKVERR
jgi:hypothetical protein